MNSLNCLIHRKTDYPPTGHGRIEKRTVSISHQLEHIPAFPGLKTLIRVESERHVHRANIIGVSKETRYYVSSLVESAHDFAQRIRGYR